MYTSGEFSETTTVVSGYGAVYDDICTTEVGQLVSALFIAHSGNCDVMEFNDDGKIVAFRSYVQCEDDWTSDLVNYDVSGESLASTLRDWRYFGLL